MSGSGGGGGGAGTERGGRKALSKSRGKAERRACGPVFGRSMRPCPVVPASDAVYLPPRRAARQQRRRRHTATAIATARTVADDDAEDRPYSEHDSTVVSFV